ncbi:spore germination protein [Paenibacillus sp. P36]|uniref:spore germination protein n=1 Tax=Paenibacillus sp. P36 TaxID=3342538 RepID=UPI0038B28DBD
MSTQSNLATPKSEQQPGMSTNLQMNLSRLTEELGHTDDLNIRMIEMDDPVLLSAAIVYFTGMTEIQHVNNIILRALDYKSMLPGKPDVLSFLEEIVTTTCSSSIQDQWDPMMSALLMGSAILFIDDCHKAIICSIQSLEGRPVSEPTTQAVIRGPKDSFVEVMETNISLVRRRITHTGLRVHNLHVGKISGTKIALIYMDRVAKPEHVADIQSKLASIAIDSVLDSGYIEEFFQKNKYSLFPTVFNTERPDTVTAGILEGKIAVFVDGSPFALLLPTTFSQFMISPEDYYQRFQFGSFTRVLRYIAFLISIFSSSLYIAFTTFHKEMIPTPLLISLAAQREGIPFPAFFEALVMEIIFEFLREAGVRMPRVMGQAVSIVGALVLGEAAVAAGLVSSAMVIIVSITAICNFTTPSNTLSVSTRLIRFIFMIIAATFGLYGIVLGFIIMIAHLVSLESLGMPYMSPFAPANLQKLKDAIIRFPLSMFQRNQQVKNGPGERN